MRGKKRLLYAVSSVVLLGSLLAGCGPDNKENAAPSEGSAAAPTASNEKYKISIFNTASFRANLPVPPVAKDPIRQMLEKNMNIELDMTVTTGDQAYNKLNVLIASSQVPDIMYFDTRANAIKYYEQGVTADLDELLASAPSLVSGFDASRWEPMKYKGKTIGIPGVEAVGGITGWWINNDWLKKLNLKAPTTPDELLEVMKAFTFNDPDGNGQNDTYGFVAGLSKEGVLAFGWEQIFHMFGVRNNLIDVENGKLIVDNVDPRMKEAIAFANKMIEAKVVDPDWVSINVGTQIEDKLYKGKVGILVSDWRAQEPDKQQKMQETGGSVPDWMLIPPMTGPHGDQVLDLTPFQSAQWAISKNVANDPAKAKRVIELMQYMYTDPEAYNTMAYGMKDVTWTEENGKPKLIPRDTYNEKEVEWRYHYAFVRKADDAVYFDFKNPKTQENHDLNLKYLKENNVNPRLVPDVNDALRTDRDTYMNEMLTKFVSGKEPLEKWDDYVSTLQTKFKLDDMIGYYTQQLKDEGILQ